MQRSVLILFLTATTLMLATIRENVQANVLNTLKLGWRNKQKISDYYLYYPDSTGSCTVNTALQALDKGFFLKPEPGGDIFNSHYHGDSYWLVIAIQNDSNTTLPLLWCFYNNNLTYTLYNITDRSKPRLTDSITHLLKPDSLRYAIREPAFYFPLRPYDSAVYMVHVRKLNTDNIYFPMEISTAEDQLIWEKDYDFLVGSYMGWFVFAFVFNVCLWVIMKAKIHFHHACFILFLICFSLSEDMFDVVLLPYSIYSYFALIPKILWLGGAAIFGITVMQLYIQQHKRYGLLYSIFYYCKLFLAIISVGLLIASLSGFTQSPMMSALRKSIIGLIFMGYLLMLIQMIYGVVKKDRLMWVYVLSNLYFTIAAIDFMFADMFGGLLPYLEPGNILIGLSIEIFILTVAFIYRQNQEIKMSVISLQTAERMKTEAAKSMLDVQQNVQHRIAQNLHDSLGTSISSLRFFVANYFRGKKQKAEEDEKFRKECDARISDLSDEARQIAHELMPQDFARTGLISVLQNRVDDLNLHSDISFQFKANIARSKLSRDLQLMLYRLISEFLQNIIRHSGASKGIITYFEDDVHILLSVTDNGIGFDIQNNTNGIGINGAALALGYSGGEMHIDSNKDGTNISIELPLQ